MKTVIEMARSVEAGEPASLYGRTDYVVFTKSELERFAELVRADEREACAKVCDNGVDTEHPTVKGHIMKDFGASKLLAAAIRARSNT